MDAIAAEQADTAVPRGLHIALVMASGNATFSGGVPAVVLARARYLVSQGVAVSIVCKAGPGLDRPEQREGFHIDPIRSARVPNKLFASIQSSSPVFLRALGRGLEAAHRRRPIDLVDLQDGPAILGVGPFCRRHGIPMSFTLHGSARINPGRRPWLGRRLHLLYERLAYAQAAHILPVSRYIGRVPALYGVIDKPVTVIPNTVGTHWSALPRRNDPAAPRLALLFMGRLVPEKRPDIALRALALLPAAGFALTVAGDGPERDALRRLAVELGVADRVDWRGHIHDRKVIERLMQEADVFVFPTIFEAHPIALLEAVAAGLYPLVAAIPVMMETVPAEYGFTADDPAALAARIAALAADRGRIAAAEPALREIGARYAAERVYPQLLETYRSIIAHAPPARGRSA